MAIFGLLPRGLIIFVIFMFFVMPFIVVALSAFAGTWAGTILPADYTTKWFAGLGQTDWFALSMSLMVAVEVAIIATVVSIWLALTVKARNDRMSKLLDSLAMFPISVPSVVLGLAVLISYSSAPFDVSSSSQIVVLGQTALVLPFAYRIIAASLQQDLPAMTEAARTLGAPPVMVLRDVTLPTLAPAIRTSIAFSMAISLGELGVTMMVYPPGFATVPIEVIGKVNRGFYYEASALALILLCLSLVILMAIAYVRFDIFRKKRRAPAAADPKAVAAGA